jgi:hypothetical protein
MIIDQEGMNIKIIIYIFPKIIEENLSHIIDRINGGQNKESHIIQKLNKLNYDFINEAPRSPLMEKQDNISNHSPVHHLNEGEDRKSLIAQLDELKHKLHYNYQQNHEEVDNMMFGKDKDEEIKQILTHKDALVEESRMKIQKLKRDIEEEEKKAERIREENILMQK